MPPRNLPKPESLRKPKRVEPIETKAEPSKLSVKPTTRVPSQLSKLSSKKKASGAKEKTVKIVEPTSEEKS